MGRLIGTTTQYSFLPGSTFTNSYTYDAGSNRLSLTAPDGSITTYGYDSLNRVNDIASSWAGSFGFGYDALSRRTSLTRPNGVNTSYTYDSVSRLLSVLHQAGGTTLDGASYTYDAAGNRTGKTNYLNGITDNYAYDALYQLQQVTEGTSTTESYTYDPVGNRLSSLSVPQYNYNTSNELTSTSLASYTYDHNGNTLTKADSNGTTQYSWDYENRLTQVTIPQTGGGSTVVTFKYDPFGRRIQKIAPGGTTNYLYDQVSMLEEFDISGNMVVAKYAQGTAIDEPLSMMRSGNVSYDNADALGSITSLVNPAGTLATTYIYDTFGELVGSTGSLTNPFQYTGRDHDPETKLDYYRARYYDAGTGRFLPEDPAGFGGGANFFAYVKNDPADFVDPTGLKCWQSSPWTEIPNLWGPNGPTPYLTMEDGLYWVRVGWSYVSWGLISDYTHCSCRWVADHTRMRKFYRYKTTEQAQFTCDCPSSTYYEKRERTKNYEVDSPGIPSWPTQYANTTGPTLQVGEDTGSNFRNKKNVTCLCGPPAP